MWKLRPILRSMRKVLIRRPMARLSIHALSRENDETRRRIGTALASVLQGTLDSREAALIGAIEGIRNRWLASRDNVCITDFGACALGNEGRSTTMSIARICRGSRSSGSALVLFKLIRNLEPLSCLELGTSLGISGAYQAAALSLNRRGQITTIEGDPVLASMAEKAFVELALQNIKVVTGRFQDTLDEVLQQNGPVDFAFIDGHHEENATISYYERVLESASDNPVFVFDDIRWSDGMRRAWSRLQSDRRTNLCIDMGSMGLCVVHAGGMPKRSLNIRLD